MWRHNVRALHDCGQQAVPPLGCMTSETCGFKRRAPATLDECSKQIGARTNTACIYKWLRAFECGECTCTSHGLLLRTELFGPLAPQVVVHQCAPDTQPKEGEWARRPLATLHLPALRLSC